MIHRQLGRSGLRISALTMGTMTFGGTGKFADVGRTGLDLAREQIDVCLEAGINLIDTADIYSDGMSEEIVGEALVGRRDDVLVATKARFGMGPGANDAGLSRHHLIRACEASLRRLQSDHIDLYQLHEWDGQTPLEETLAALDHLVQSGKVRYVGVSNFAGWQLLKTIGIAERDRRPWIVSEQIHYSLQSRDAEYELIPAAIDQGLGVLVWSPLGGGLLSGKYRRDQAPPEGSRLLGEWSEPPVYDQDKLYDTVDVLVEIAAARGATPAQVALAWLVAQPGVTSVIVGARTTEQLRENLACMELELDAAELQRLDDVSRPPLLYPYWHQAASASERLSAADRSLLDRHRPKPETTAV